MQIVFVVPLKKRCVNGTELRLTEYKLTEELSESSLVLLGQKLISWSKAQSLPVISNAFRSWYREGYFLSLRYLTVKGTAIEE